MHVQSAMTVRRPAAAPPSLRGRTPCLRLILASRLSKAYIRPMRGVAMETSLFLGAGMSAVYGMPLTEEFRNRMLRRHPDRPVWSRLLEDPDLQRMEDVWAAVEFFNSFATMPGNDYWIRKLEGAGADRRELADLQDALVSELFDACRWRHANDHLLDSVLRPVLTLASSAGYGGVRVFTTNYDRSVEEYCSDPSRGFRCHDGFANDPQTGRNLWSGFAGQPDPWGQGAEGALDTLSLFKIHGSLGWMASRHGPERTAYEAKSADPNYRDVLVCPSSLPKSAYNGLHADIFQGFAEGLQASDACVVVGYSFRDRLIAEQFARFVEDGKTLVAVGPEAGASLNNVLRPAAVGGGPAGWAQAGASHFVYSGGSGAPVHAIQEAIRPETVDRTVMAARDAVAMPPDMAASYAAAAALSQGTESGASAMRGYSITRDRYGRRTRARGR